MNKDNLSKEQTFTKKSIKEQVFNRNLGLAYNIAKKYRPLTKNHDDLNQIALMTLWECIGRYKEDMNVKFSTYASRSIDGKLKEFVLNENGISKKGSYAIYMTSLYICRNKERGVNEIKEALKDKKWYCIEDEDLVRVYNNVMDGYVRMDEGEVEESFSNTLEDKTQNVQKDIEDREGLTELLDKIDECARRYEDKTQKVVQLLVDNALNGNQWTYEDIGKMCGVSKQRVGQVVAQMAKKIKKMEQKKNEEY